MNCFVILGIDVIVVGEGVEIKVFDFGCLSSDDIVISVIRGEKKWMMVILVVMVMVGVVVVGELVMVFNWFG